MIAMAVNKVIYGGSTLIDLSGDTVSPDKLLAGYTAHAADGTAIDGMYSLTDDSYVWEQFDGDPSIPAETAKTNVTIITYAASVGYLSVTYADSAEVVDGAVTLVDPIKLSLGKNYSQTSVDALIGKYVKTSVSGCVLIPEGATISKSSSKDVVASSANILSVRKILQYVTSQASDAYPTNGAHTDGYWYVYKGLLSDLMNSSGGASDPTLQEKTATPSENQQTVAPDSGYDGLSKVTVEAVSSTYVGSSVPRQSAAIYTPGTVDQTIASGQYLDGEQTIKGDANLAASNIKSGVSIFGVSGNYSGEGGSDTNNCEAYHITSASTSLSFQGTGTVKVWGYGYKSSGYTTTVYSFVGDGYYSGSWGTPTKTSATFGLNSDGTLSGLPRGLAGIDLLVTIGI